MKEKRLSQAADKARRMPPKVKIRAAWALTLSAEYGKFDSMEEVVEDDYCFACGFKAITERAHILARAYGGSDAISNIHLLCRACHEASEDSHGEKYWEWFKRRDIVDVAVTVCVQLFGYRNAMNPEFMEVKGKEAIARIREQERRRAAKAEAASAEGKE